MERKYIDGIYKPVPTKYKMTFLSNIVYHVLLIITKGKTKKEVE